MLRRLQIGLIALIPLILVFSETGDAAGSPAPEKLEYSGRYEWNLGGSGRLDVTFFPEDNGDWEITVRFDHAGRFQTWNGTAIGDLGNGKLEGRVRNGSYQIHGSFADGVFVGKHFHVSRRGLKESGTLRFE